MIIKRMDVKTGVFLSVNSTNRIFQLQSLLPVKIKIAVDVTVEHVQQLNVEYLNGITYFKYIVCCTEVDENYISCISGRHWGLSISSKAYVCALVYPISVYIGYSNCIKMTQAKLFAYEHAVCTPMRCIVGTV